MRRFLVLAGLAVIVVVGAIVLLRESSPDHGQSMDTMSGDTMSTDTMSGDASMADEALAEGMVAAELGDLQILAPFARASAGANGAAYFTIRNTGATDDVLVSARASVSQAVELHSVRMDDDGVMAMMPLADGIPVAAGQIVVLAPGGLHVMFVGLNDPLTEGGSVSLTLVFRDAGETTITVPVGDLGAGMAMDGNTDGDATTDSGDN
ncbi:MAG: copper chaperone PCu(A)C [Alphaproteobacteria bacterium]